MDRAGCVVEAGIQANPDATHAEARREPPKRGRKERCAQAAKKSFSVNCVRSPYRKPTPVGRGKDPKVDERSSVKELGKLTP